MERRPARAAVRLARIPKNLRRGPAIGFCMSRPYETPQIGGAPRFISAWAGAGSSLCTSSAETLRSRPKRVTPKSKRRPPAFLHSFFSLISGRPRRESRGRSSSGPKDSTRKRAFSLRLVFAIFLVLIRVVSSGGISVFHFYCLISIIQHRHELSDSLG